MIKAILFDLLDVLYPDTGSSLEVVREMKKRRLFTIAITSLKKNQVLDLVERFDLDDYYITSELDLDKERPEIYQKVLADYHLVGEECIFIDDQIENLLASKGLGIKTVWLSKMSNFSKKIDEKITKLEDLVDLVDKLQK